MKITNIIKQKREMNKSGVSEMISYVILIAIAIGLSIAVYIWLKDYANVSPKIDCKEGTSLILEDYTITATNLQLTLKNNGYFNIDGFILTVGNNTKRMPIEMLPSIGGGPRGYYDFSTPLKPGEINDESRFMKEIDYNVRVIQIQPYIKEKNKIIVCEQAVIKQEVD